MSVKLKFKRVRLNKNIVLLWWFWIGFLFVFIKACSHDATCIIGFFGTIMPKPKKWFMNEWIWKELCTSQIKTLSAFSLSPHIQVLQMLAQSFIKLILWALNKLSIELNRRLCQSSESSVYSYQWKIYCSQTTVINDLIDSNQVLQSTWQTVVAKARLEFSGEARFQIFSQK